MSVPAILRSALALYLAANLNLSEASWPDDKQETAGLGEDKTGSEELFASSRCDYEGRGRVRCQQQSVQSHGRILRAEPGDYRYGKGEFPADVMFDCLISRSCKPKMKDLFIKTDRQVDKENLQVGVELVCDADKMRPLWHKLKSQLKDYKLTRRLPAQLFGKSLHEHGCNTASRLRHALAGCRWYKKVSRGQIVPMEQQASAADKNVRCTQDLFAASSIWAS